MIYAGDSFILSFAGSFMLFTVLNLLTTCQLLHGRGQGDSDPKQERNGKTGSALHFLNTEVGL